jgi:hypothetical protein
MRNYRILGVAASAAQSTVWRRAKYQKGKLDEVVSDHVQTFKPATEKPERGWSFEELLGLVRRQH